MNAQEAKKHIRIDLPQCSDFVQVGEGTFGIVYSCKMGDRVIAVKQISLINIDQDILPYIEQEIEVMRKVRGEHIVEYLFDLRTQQYVYLGLEYCRVETSYVQDQIFDTYVPERFVRLWMKQMASAFYDLHQNNVIHRDLKVENVLLSITEDQLERLKQGDHDVLYECKFKLADMGMAKMLDEINKTTSTYVGSPFTMAPEIHNQEDYGLEADLYSLGVCAYLLLFGQYPFEHQDIEQIKDVIQQQDIKFDPNVQLSEDMKILLKSLLKYDPSQRMKWSEFYERFLIQKEELAFINFKQLQTETIAHKYQELEKHQTLQIVQEEEQHNQFQPQVQLNRDLYDEVDIIKISKPVEFEYDSEEEIVDYDNKGGYIQFINRVANHRNQYLVILLACEKLRFLRAICQPGSVLLGDLGKLYLYFYKVSSQIHQVLFKDINSQKNFLSISHVSWHNVQLRPEYKRLTEIIQKDQNILEEIKNETNHLGIGPSFYEKYFQNNQPFDAQTHLGEYKKKVAEALQTLKAESINTPNAQPALMAQIYIVLSVQLLSQPVNDEDQSVRFDHFEQRNTEQLQRILKDIESSIQ